MAFAIVTALVAYAVIEHAIKRLAPNTVVQQAPVVVLPQSFAPSVANAPVTPVAPAKPLPRDQVTHMTAAQQREWQRKNDEAMKILEKTTPALAR